MKKNENGFSALEVILIVIITGLVGFAGWSVLSRKSDDKKDSEPVAKTSEQKKETGQTITNTSPSFTFTLPDGWSKMACEEASVLIFPDNDKATDCSDRTNLVFVSQDVYAPSEPLHCLTQEEVAAVQKSKPLESYVCSTLTIDGKQVIKQVTDQGMDEESNRVKSVNYAFVQDKPLRFRYSSTKDGALLHEDIAEQIVKSVKF